MVVAFGLPVALRHLLVVAPDLLEQRRVGLGHPVGRDPLHRRRVVLDRLRLVGEVVERAVRQHEGDVLVLEHEVAEVPRLGLVGRELPGLGSVLLPALRKVAVDDRVELRVLARLLVLVGVPALGHELPHAVLPLLLVGPDRRARIRGVGHPLALGVGDAHPGHLAVAVDVRGRILAHPAVAIVVDAGSGRLDLAQRLREARLRRVRVRARDHVERGRVEQLLRARVARVALGEVPRVVEREPAGPHARPVDVGDEQDRRAPGRDRPGGDAQRLDLAPAARGERADRDDRHEVLVFGRESRHRDLHVVVLEQGSARGVLGSGGSDAEGDRGEQQCAEHGRRGYRRDRSRRRTARLRPRAS